MYVNRPIVGPSSFGIHPEGRQSAVHTRRRAGRRSDPSSVRQTWRNRCRGPGQGGMLTRKTVVRNPMILHRYRHLHSSQSDFTENNCSILLTQKRRTALCNPGATTRRM